MERKRFINILFSALWVVLLLLIFVVFFKDRLSNLPALLKKLRREPQALVQGFKPRDMAGFRCTFEKPDDSEYWITNNTRLEIVSSLLAPGDTWAKVTYFPAAAPGILMTDETIGLVDWRQAESLSFSTYNPYSWPVDLKIKVKDNAGNVFQKNVTLPPQQLKQLKIPVKEIAERINASRVAYLNLFLWEPVTETTLYYSNFEFLNQQSPSLQTAHIRFMGLEFPRTVKRGETVEGVFYFMPQRQLGTDNVLLLRLRRGGDLYPLVQISPPTPTSKWHPDRLAKVGPFPVAIPEGIEPGEYDLEVILAWPTEAEGGFQYIFQPYDNPELDGFAVMKISVTDAGRE